jgi:hypothetical protein
MSVYTSSYISFRIWVAIFFELVLPVIALCLRASPFPATRFLIDAVTSIESLAQRRFCPCRGPLYGPKSS